MLTQTLHDDHRRPQNCTLVGFSALCVHAMRQEVTTGEPEFGSFSIFRVRSADVLSQCRCGQSRRNVNCSNNHSWWTEELMRGLASLLCFVFRNWRFELTATWERSRRRWFASPIKLVLLQTQTASHMGCCTSKSNIDEDSPLTGTGICQKQLYPPHTSPTGLQVESTSQYSACKTCASWLCCTSWVLL